jgi:hypothetical protein
MDIATTRTRLLVGATVLLCLVVAVPIALAGDSVDPQAGASASVQKKVKKLKKKVKRVNKRVKALEREQGQPRPPSGPAGGDLAGEYPNPLIANGALGTGGFSSSIPAVHVTRTAAQSIPSGTVAALNFNAERYDTAGMHSNATNNSRLTAPVTGIYAVTAQVAWGSDPAPGIRSVDLERNGAAPIAAVNQEQTTEVPPFQEVTTQVRLQAGDFVRVLVQHGEAGAQDVIKDPDYTPEFSMTWLAPGP